MGSYNYISFIVILLSFTCMNCVGTDSNDDSFINCIYEVNSGNGFVDKLQRYSNSASNSLPCYSRCFVHGRGLFNIETNKWNKQHIVDSFGADVYNYCRHELNRSYSNGCEYAYRGWQCLQQAEININNTKSILLECANKLNADMAQLQQYIKFERTETIPCLFKCFAEQMNLYTAELKRNSSSWIQAFGPVRQKDINFTVCNLSLQRKNTTDVCNWMYEDYMCLERFIYNTEGLYAVTEE